MSESEGSGVSDAPSTEPRQWELSCLVDYFLDARRYDFTLERGDASDWTLSLHGFTLREAWMDSDDDAIEAPGTSIEWANCDEFWDGAQQLADGDYQVHPSYLLAMFRDAGDPELEGLADALEAMRAP